MTRDADGVGQLDCQFERSLVSPIELSQALELVLGVYENVVSASNAGELDFELVSDLKDVVRILRGAEQRGAST